MKKLIGKWEMLPTKSTNQDSSFRKNNTYIIKQVDKNTMMIQSEWVTTDNKSGFIGYTVNADGIPRKDRWTDSKFVGKFRGNNVLTTSTLIDDQVESMVVREVLDNGELKMTKINISNEGEQITHVHYYKRVD